MGYGAGYGGGTIPWGWGGGGPQERATRTHIYIYCVYIIIDHVLTAPFTFPKIPGTCGTNPTKNNHLKDIPSKTLRGPRDLWEFLASLVEVQGQVFPLIPQKLGVSSRKWSGPTFVIRSNKTRSCHIWTFYTKTLWEFGIGKKQSQRICLFLAVSC